MTVRSRHQEYLLPFAIRMMLFAELKSNFHANVYIFIYIWETETIKPIFYTL